MSLSLARLVRASLSSCLLWSVGASALAYDQATPAGITNSPKPIPDQLSPVSIDQKYFQTNIPSDSNPSSLTLKGAISTAVVQNRGVKEAQLQVNRLNWDCLAAETTRLPRVQVLSYLADQTINTLLIPSRTNAFFMTSALFPITQQYRIGLEVGALRLGKEIAAQKLRQQLDETKAKVKAAYYKLVLEQSLLSDIQDSIRYLNELQITVNEQVKRGDSLKVESMQVQARLAKAQLEELKAKNAFEVDREKLNLLLGRPLKTSVNLEAMPAPSESEINVEKAEIEALAMRPEIRQADARVKQLKLEKRALLSDYIPNVSAGVVYIYLPGFNNAVVPKNILAPGLFMNWQGFDWGRKAMAAKAKSKAAQAASLTAENAREEVLIDLHTQMNKLTEARQFVSTSQLARAAAREELRVSINRYKYTAAKLADVLQAQSSLADANNSYHQALLSFWEANAEFERAVGAE